MESECPRCKRKFGPDVQLECPFCSTLVSPHLDSCPSCQINYDDFVDSAEEQLWQKAFDKIVEELEDLKSEAQAPAPVTAPQPAPAAPPVVRAPAPQKASEPPPEKPKQQPAEPSEAEEEALCPICGMMTKITDPACPWCGAEFEEEETEVVPEEETAICPVCEAVVSTHIGKCPSCGAQFEEEEVEAPKEEPKPVPVPQIITPKKVVPRPPKPPLKRKPDGLVTSPPVAQTKSGVGRSNGISFTNGAGKTNGKGLVNGSGAINGRGHTNGTHLVNGLGAVNGKALVNGTGVSNGIGAGGFRGRGGRKVPIYMHWKFLAVLIAVAIIVPSYLQFAHFGDEGPYSIDGEFEDWEEAVMYTASSVTPAGDTDIAEWSVGAHLDSVYMYVHMTHDVMVGPEAERLVLFVDSDNSQATGYSVGGIGADFMMESFGWNGTVRSAALSAYDDDEDLSNWNSWSAAGTVETGISGDQFEAKGRLTSGLNASAKFILTTQGQDSVDCASYPVVLNGGLLIVEQSPVQSVAATEIVPIGPSEEMLRLRFTCEGESGTVEGVAPVLAGVTASEPVAAFSLNVGQERIIDVLVDTSALAPGQYVSVGVTVQSIVSSFDCVRIIGVPAMAYAGAPPSGISIDGAFADWTNQTVKDVDGMPVDNPNVDIDEVGGNSTSENSFFYVSVMGELCAGTYIPKTCVVPTGSGNGTVIPIRRTAEDVLRVYIDSDMSSSSGLVVTVGPITIGADYMIEVRGLCCVIAEVITNVFDDGYWIPLDVDAEAAKDLSRMEIGVPATAIGGATEVAFIIETTDWNACGDDATNQTYSLTMRTFAVDSTGTSQYATSMSYQRKLFYDGTNNWAFFFDGSNTVCKYSTDGGETWTSRGSVFTTSGVREVSIWYDSTNDVVYAVGDTATSGTSVYIQKGTVNPASHTITWAGSDSTLATSTRNLAGKNTYISRDANGYVWLGSSNCTQTSPTTKYQFSVWRSASANSITSWSFSAGMLGASLTTYAEVRGSVVPAGSGSDMWAVFAYDSAIYSKKYASGTWETNAKTVYTASGTQNENTVNSPPSVVVNSKGTVHVVYGDKTLDGTVSKPHIYYTYNNTGATDWATAVDLDSSKPSNVGDVYPTISLDSTNNALFVFWLRTDTSAVPKTVMGVTKTTGSWSALSLGTQSSYTKNYLTSIYSVESGGMICWLWTQNTTGTIEVMYDAIPEFQDLVLPILSILIVFIVVSRRGRSRK